MNARPSAFSGLVSAMAAQPRTTAPPAAPSGREALTPRERDAARINRTAARNPLRRDDAVMGQGAALGTSPVQRPEAGSTIIEYFRAKAARGEYGTYDPIRVCAPKFFRGRQ